MSSHIITIGIFAAGLLIAMFSWLFKNIIWAPIQKNIGSIDELKRKITALEMAMRYYFESVGKGAAAVLDTPNPAPPPMRLLLRKHANGTISEDEREALRAWLKQVRDSPNTDRDERSAAYSLLGALGGIKRLDDASK